MTRWGWLAAFVMTMGCSSDNEVKLDYTVSFSDAAGKNLGTVESGSLSGIQSTVPQKTLANSMATFSAVSDMSGLHFTIVEDGVRKGILTCTAQSGTGTQQAQANVN